MYYKNNNAFIKGLITNNNNDIFYEKFQLYILLNFGTL